MGHRGGLYHRRRIYGAVKAWSGRGRRSGSVTIITLVVLSYGTQKEDKTMPRKPQRVITGHNAQGKSVVLFHDEPV